MRLLKKHIPRLQRSSWQSRRLVGAVSSAAGQHSSHAGGTHLARSKIHVNCRGTDERRLRCRVSRASDFSAVHVATARRDMAVHRYRGGALQEACSHNSNNNPHVADLHVRVRALPVCGGAGTGYDRPASPNFSKVTLSSRVVTSSGSTQRTRRGLGEHLRTSRRALLLEHAARRGL